MMMSKTLEEGGHTYTHICRALGNKKRKRNREYNESIDYLKKLIENLPENRKIFQVRFSYASRGENASWYFYRGNH